MDPFVTVVVACCMMSAIERDIREDCAASKDAAPAGPALPKRGDISTPHNNNNNNNLGSVRVEPPVLPGAVPPVIETYRRPHMYPGPIVNEHGQELTYHEIRGKVVWRVA